MKVLISSCLLGEQVRYNGTHAKIDNKFLEELKKENLVIGCCPEILAGYKVPRLPAEIKGGDGNNVINGAAKVLQNNGVDVTKDFLLGAEFALKTALDNNVKMAILKDRSPSCGSVLRYDGTFSGNVFFGGGILAALLTKNNIMIFSVYRFITYETADSSDIG